MANVKEIVGFLQKVPLFTALKPGQKESLAKRFVERQYQKGDKIVTQGMGGEGLFIIVNGEAEAFRTKADGTQVQVNTFGPTNFFGELALLDDGLRTASVVTTAPTQCLVLTRWDFISSLREDPDMSIAVLEEMARRFRMVLDTM